MKILAMDTSSVNSTVCISDENKIIGEYTVSNDRAHSQIIMPMLDALLNNCSLTIKDIDVFAVALGPGSFTGLRIGIAAMKTLAQSLSKPIIGASSLDEIAYSFFATDSIVCPILDARRNEVYNALYLKGRKIVTERVVDLPLLAAPVISTMPPLHLLNSITCSGIPSFCASGSSKGTNLRTAAKEPRCLYMFALKRPIPLTENEKSISLSGSLSFSSGMFEILKISRTSTSVSAVVRMPSPSLEITPCAL